MISNYMTSDDVTFEITGNDKFEIITEKAKKLISNVKAAQK